MNAVFRHMAIRLWATALIGGLVTIALLPAWQSVLEIHWVSVPAFIVLLGCFGSIGWAMNRLGLMTIQRLMHEAAVWERSGMTEDALATFQRALALFDSFWLSPLYRRHGEELITARLTRFYLSLPATGRRGQQLIRAYLFRHPEDATVAQTWLEQLLASRPDDSADHELAALIADTLEDHDRIQQLLVQVYLSANRSDFEALQTYRRIWQQQRSLPDDLVRSLARLLLSEFCLNDWALQVYLKGYEVGDPYCLEGIAGVLRHLPSHAGNRRDWAKAEAVIASLDPGLREKVAGRFKPAGPSAAVPLISDKQPKKQFKTTRQATARAATLVLGAIYQAAAGLGRKVHTFWRGQRVVLHPGRVGAVLAVGLVLGVGLVTGYRSMGHRTAPKVPEPVIESPLPPVELPFTIQVAAYVKPEDAQRYVDQLKKKGLEAFSNKATSSSQKWFQVKVSRFETRRQAHEYGEKLKSQGVIDDFYVANYEQ